MDASWGFRSGESIDWKNDARHGKNIDRKTAKKQEYYRPYVADADVLHIGAGGGTQGRADDHAEWFHAWLDREAKAAVGIDTDSDAITAAREAGFDVREAEATEFDLGEKFDTVVVPNVIEHVSNPGLLLDCARDHLRPGGSLVLTTPTPVSYWYLTREIFGGRETHPGHVQLWGAPEMANLLERCGFRVNHHERFWFKRVGMSTADSVFAMLERVVDHLPVLERGVAVQLFFVAEPASSSPTP